MQQHSNEQHQQLLQSQQQHSYNSTPRRHHNEGGGSDNPSSLITAAPRNNSIRITAIPSPGGTSTFVLAPYHSPPNTLAGGANATGNGNTTAVASNNTPPTPHRTSFSNNNNNTTTMNSLSPKKILVAPSDNQDDTFSFQPSSSTQDFNLPGVATTITVASNNTNDPPIKSILKRSNTAGGGLKRMPTKIGTAIGGGNSNNVTSLINNNSIGDTTPLPSSINLPPSSSNTTTTTSTVPLNTTTSKQQSASAAAARRSRQAAMKVRQMSRGSLLRKVGPGGAASTLNNTWMVHGASHRSGIGGVLGMNPALLNSLIPYRYGYDRYGRKLSHTQALLQAILRHWTILSPKSTWRLYWNFVIFVMILYYLIEIPLRLGFHFSSNCATCPTTILHVLCDIFFMVDCLVLQLRTGYYLAEGEEESSGGSVNQSTTHQSSDLNSSSSSSSSSSSNTNHILELNPLKVLSHYLKRWFLFDLLTSFPIHHILGWVYDIDGNRDDSTDESQYNIINIFIQVCYLLRMLKFFRFLPVFSYYHKLELFAGTILSDILKIFRFIFGFFLISHIAACMWMFLAWQEMKQIGGGMNGVSSYSSSSSSISTGVWEVRTWPGNLGYTLPLNITETRAYLDNQTAHGYLTARVSENMLYDLQSQIHVYENIHSQGGMTSDLAYLMAMYWAVSTMTTVGYGDIIPRSDSELVYACLVIFIGAVIFGYIISNVSNIIQIEDDTDTKIREKIASINSYMAFRKLPSDLQRKIRQHYEYLWTKKTVYDEKLLMKGLPTSLRTRVALYLHQDLIRNVSFLRDLGSDCLALLVTELRPFRISAGNWIFKVNSIGKEMCFIDDGLVEVLGPKNKQLAILQKGAYFGEFSVLSNRPTKRSASVRALTTTDLFSLSMESFHEILEVYPELKEEVQIHAEARLREAVEGKLERDYTKIKMAMVATTNQTVLLAGSGTQPPPPPPLNTNDTTFSTTVPQLSPSRKRLSGSPRGSNGTFTAGFRPASAAGVNGTMISPPQTSPPQPLTASAALPHLLPCPSPPTTRAASRHSRNSSRSMIMIQQQVQQQVQQAQQAQQMQQQIHQQQQVSAGGNTRSAIPMLPSMTPRGSITQTTTSALAPPTTTLPPRGSLPTSLQHTTPLRVTTLGFNPYLSLPSSRGDSGNGHSNGVLSDENTIRRTVLRGKEQLESIMHPELATEIHQESLEAEAILDQQIQAEKEFMEVHAGIVSSSGSTMGKPDSMTAQRLSIIQQRANQAISYYGTNVGNMNNAIASGAFATGAMSTPPRLPITANNGNLSVTSSPAFGPVPPPILATTNPSTPVLIPAVSSTTSAIMTPFTSPPQASSSIFSLQQLQQIRRGSSGGANSNQLHLLQAAAPHTMSSRANVMHVSPNLRGRTIGSPTVVASTSVTTAAASSPSLPPADSIDPASATLSSTLMDKLQATIESTLQATTKYKQSPATTSNSNTLQSDHELESFLNELERE